MAALKRNSIRKHALIVLAVFAIYLSGHWFIREHIFISKSYWPNGNLRESAHYWPNAGDFLGSGSYKDGLTQEWYENGNLKFEGNWKLNQLDGMHTWYSDDGRVLDSWLYVDGNPVDGKRISYWPNGKVKAEINYKSGMLNGRQAEWTMNGRLLSDWIYSNGLPADGIQEIFDDSGRIIQRSIRHSGLMDGDCFNIYGNTKVETIYVRGKKSRVKQFNDDGSIYSNSEFDGTLDRLIHMQIFYPNGKIKSDELRTSDNRIEIKKWDEKGNLVNNGTK